MDRITATVTRIGVTPPTSSVCQHPDMETVVGVFLILLGVFLAVIAIPPVSWVGLTFLLGGLLLIGLGVRELRLASRLRDG